MTRTPILSALTAAVLAAAFGAAQAAPATYKIDPTHTFVTFEAKHFGTSTNRGRFDKKAGTVTLDKAAKTGKAEGHLKGKDFLSAEAFPTATFVSDQFKFDGDKVTEVVGKLTLLGKTQPVTLKATSFNCYDNPILKREVCGGDFETTIKRSEYGITYGLPGIPDEIKLDIQIEAVKQ
jgi:polyisoprenoid-binding protein YceI